MIEGCEADDVRHLIQSNGQSRWQGRPRQLGRWSFSHVAEVICTLKNCSISTNLLITFPDRRDSRDDAWDEIEPALPYHDRDVARTRILQDQIAADLRENIKATSYANTPNEIAAVWVDYGKLSALIRVRARTIIQCKTDHDICTIHNNIIAFVPYDEHHPCGYLSIGEDVEDFLF